MKEGTAGVGLDWNNDIYGGEGALLEMEYSICSGLLLFTYSLPDSLITGTELKGSRTPYPRKKQSAPANLLKQTLSNDQYTY